MSVERINVTIGTAGHIDHGKTALVKLLTGCDTDRLKAEKERGMSIDLGFAPCTVADTEVGIVDVPGHENFIKTMVAGAAGMDGVVLVVAADDGVMPQTREHLDILTLLGVQHGFVALTKIDRVEKDQVAVARAETQELLRGTYLEGAPICPVSNVTGEGFDRFHEALAEMLRAVARRPTHGVFRLPLDRAFSASGYGTVVAGIPVSGQARPGDELVLLPGGQHGRIRQIEVYGRAADMVMAGQCAALNVRHWDHRTIHRGDTVATPGYFAPHQWLACKLNLLPLDKLTLKSGAQLKLHTGTSEVAAAVYPMKGDRMHPGDEYLVQIQAKTPLVAGPGDRFIVRTLSPVRTVGGGMVIEAVPARLKRTRPNVFEDVLERVRAVPEPSRFVEYCVRTAESLAVHQADLGVRAKILPARLKEILADLTQHDRIIPLTPHLYIHRETAADAGRRVLEVVRDFHRQSPESPGPITKQLRETCQLDKAVLDAVVALLKQQGQVVEQNGRLALPEHRAEFRDEDARFLETIESLYRRQAFCPPTAEEIAEKTGATQETVERVLRILTEHERLVQVADKLLFHREAVGRARDILVAFVREEGKLESVRFKYLLDTTRKFAIPLLDYFDSIGLTRRSGNTRYLKTSKTAHPDSPR